MTGQRGKVLKYALIDGELHRHDRDADTFLPLTLAEAQEVADTLNALAQAKRGIETTWVVPANMLPNALALVDEAVQE